MKRIVPLLLLAAAIGAYVYFNQPPTSLMLTGLVTTDDLVVSAQIAGRLTELTVREGDQVTRGQRLALLAPDELRAESQVAVHNVEGVSSQIQEARAALRYEELQMQEQVRQAESTLAATESQQAAAQADLEAARLSFERTQNLSREGVAAARELDDARTKFAAEQARVDAIRRQGEAQRATIALARAKAEQVALKRTQVQTNERMQAVAQAQQARADVRLGYAEVTAPLTGIVDVRAARVGEVVNPGQAIVTLIDPDDLWVRADIEETYIERIKVGDTLRVRLPSGAEMDGRVFYRAVDAGFATQRDVSRTKRDIKTFEIRLRCDNADRRLAVGMTAYVLLPLN